jgi:Flp pilus assembly protein TadG
MRLTPGRSQASRSGVAAVELAVLLPFLMFLFIIAVDWSRIFYYAVIIDNCARNGAMYEADYQWSTNRPPYTSTSDAALADAPNLSPAPTVATTYGTDTYGNWAECTVSWTFKTVTNFPGVPKSNNVVRKVRVYQAPRMPN